MTKEECLKELYSNKDSKIKSTVWDSNRFIYLSDKGQIIDNNGKVFNIMNAKDESWDFWVKPIDKEQSVMNKDDIINALFKGSKVKSVTWSADKFVFMNESGQIVDSNGKAFNLMATKDTEWVIWTERSNDSRVNLELLELVKSLKGEMTELKNRVIIDGMTNENQDLLKIVYDVDSIASLKELFQVALTEANTKMEVTKVITKFIPFCWLGGRKLNTIASYYRDMRTIIKEVGGDYQDLSLDLFALEGEVYDHINNKSINIVKEKAEENNKDEYDGDAMESLLLDLKRKIVDDDIDVAKQQTLERARAYLYATYLALATGRRSIEILKTLEIVKDGDTCYYQGIAKKSDNNVKIEAYSLDRDFEFLIKILAKLREDLPTNNLTAKEVNSKYNRIFNRAFKKLTNTDYTFHDAREIYSDLLYIKEGYSDGSWTEEHNFKGKILGHEIKADRLTASQYYMTKKRG